MTDARVFFRDIKPYEVPDSLNDLRGPATGTLVLDHSVFWAPGGGAVNIDEPGGIEMAYQAVISEGTVEDQAAVLNRDRLIVVWSRLMLPDRVRSLWELAFQELQPTSA